MSKVITSKDWDGITRTLVHCVDAKDAAWTPRVPVTEGEKFTDRRGDVYTVSGGRAPHKPSSSGKVWTDKGEFYPTVINCEWI